MTLKFTNEAIKKHKSKFKENKSGKTKPVITSFKLDRNTEYKGLCLREYVSGVKHFIIRFRLRGERKKERIFPIGRFDLIEDPPWGFSIFCFPTEFKHLEPCGFFIFFLLFC